MGEVSGKYIDWTFFLRKRIGCFDPPERKATRDFYGENRKEKKSKERIEAFTSRKTRTEKGRSLEKKHRIPSFLRVERSYVGKR